MNTYAIEVDHKEKMMITAKNASNALTRYLKILEKTYSVSKRCFASASKEWGGKDYTSAYLWTVNSKNKLLKRDVFAVAIRVWRKKVVTYIPS